MAAKLKVTPVVQGKKYRVHQWVDTQSLEPRYGIQANIEYGVWAHVHDGERIIFFDTAEAAKLQAKEWSA